MYTHEHVDKSNVDNFLEILHASFSLLRKDMMKY